MGILCYTFAMKNTWMATANVGLKSGIFWLLSAGAAGIIISLCAPLIAHGQLGSITYNARTVGSPIEIHVTDEGNVLVKGARIEQLAGSTIYAKVYWGEVFLRMTVRTTPGTDISKKTGTSLKVSDLKVGDFISYEGKFYSGSSAFDVMATKITNWSDQIERQEFSGTITDITNMGSTTNFVLRTKNNTLMPVIVTPDTQIIKGNLTLRFNELKKGDTVVSAFGPYNALTKTLTASAVKIYMSKESLAPRNYEGKMKVYSLEQNIFFIDINGVEYQARMKPKAPILKANRDVADPKRFLPGDKVRFYGAPREKEMTTIDAEVIRNLQM